MQSWRAVGLSLLTTLTTTTLTTLALGAAEAAAVGVDVGAYGALHLFDADGELLQKEGVRGEFEPSVLAGLRLGVWPTAFLGGEIEAAYGRTQGTVHTEGTTLQQASLHVLGLRAHLVGALPLGRFELLALVGGGAHVGAARDVTTTPGQDIDAFASAGLGVGFRVTDRLALRLDGRVQAVGSAIVDQAYGLDYESTLGMRWRFGSVAALVADADADGVPDADDRCPYEAETVNGVRDGDGCPEDPIIAKRYHRTRFVRRAARDVVASLAPRPATPAPVAPAPAGVAPAPAAAAPSETPPSALPAAATVAQIEDLEPALPLAANALPPLVSAGDDDGDGLDRDDDVCPAQAEDVDGFEDADGCPDPDNDGDGNDDDNDRCPFEAETVNGYHDADGCPEEATLALRYHKSRFATVPEGQVGVLPLLAKRLELAPLPADATYTLLPAPLPLAPGALPPLVSAGDDDGDGFVRDEDVCPDEPEDLDGFEDGDGCPEPDNDRDFVADAVDSCPLVGETQNGYHDEDGCPDVVPVPVAKLVGRLEGLQFEVNSARILDSSLPALQRVASVLTQHLNVFVEISGHTDDRGSYDANKMLSRLRAEAVRAWLVGHGGDAARIRAVGHGPDKPVASNGSDRGRARNRRVEFILITGEELLRQQGDTNGAAAQPEQAR